jgi:hypothetical protein
MPLCEPKTYTVNLNHSGKVATVLSIKKSDAAQLSPSIMNQMPPAARAQMEDIYKGGAVLFQFEDGTKLDTCAVIGFRKLSDNLDLVPGQAIASAPASSKPDVSGTGSAPSATASAPTAASVASAPQECPVVVTKISSGSGGFGHGLAEALTTSEFQRQVDETTHGGAGKHYLDMRMRNNSQRPVAAIESVVVYSNKMGDEAVSTTLMSQNDSPIKPGQEYKSSYMDREEWTQNGAGEVTVYIKRVRFTDSTKWQDDSSHSCSLSDKTNK